MLILFRKYFSQNKITIFITLINLTLSLILVSLIHADNHTNNYFIKKAYSEKAIDFINKHFGWSTLVEIMIDSKKPDGIKKPEFLKAVEYLQNHLESDSSLKVIHSSSLADIIKYVNMKLNHDNHSFYRIPVDKKVLAENLFLYNNSVPFGRDLNNQINVDLSVIRLTVRIAKGSSENTQKVVRAISDYSKKHLKKYKVTVILLEDQFKPETSVRKVNYNSFRKRFSSGQFLFIAFKDENGIFNNETITMIQRLTDKFWKTMYVTRVDSLTNYPHTHVSGDDFIVKDFIKQKTFDMTEIKALLSPYIKQGKGIKLISDILSSVLPYSRDKLKVLLEQDRVSKEDMTDLIAETLKLKLPLNKWELKGLILLHITQDYRFVDQIMRRFFPTVEEVKSFLLKYVVKGESKAHLLARELVQSNERNLKELILPYIAKKQATYDKLWFLHLKPKLSTEQIIDRLKDLLDKLPPNKQELVKLIKPYIKAGNPTNILVEALQTVFPSYYDKDTLKKWLISPILSKKELIELTAETLRAKLPLSEKELKEFIDQHITSKKRYSKKVFKQLKKMLLYTQAELMKKKMIALNDKLVKGLFVSNDGKVALIQIITKLPDFNHEKISTFLYHIKEILKKEEKRSNYRFYMTSPK